MYLAKYLAVLALVIGVLWLLSPAKPVLNYKLSDPKLLQMLEALLYRGVDGAVLDLSLSSKARSVSYIKYVSRNDRSGYECVVPLECWRERSSLELEDLLRARGFSEMRSMPAEDQDAHLVIDLGQNIPKGLSLARVLFEELAGARLYDDSVGRLNEKVLPLDSPGLAKVRRPST